VALTFSLAYPTRVRRLVLVDAAGLSGQKAPGLFALARLPVLSSILRWVTPRFLVRENVEQIYAVDTRITDAVVERYYQLARREGNRAAVIARFRGTPYPDLDARIGEIHVSTLILWGEQDSWIPLSFARRFQAAIADARLITYPDAAHVPMEELPQQTARDVEAFLSAP
jgi:pimeloyl-ACP methyl ester carboxylesterase